MKQQLKKQTAFSTEPQSTGELHNIGLNIIYNNYIDTVSNPINSDALNKSAREALKKFVDSQISIEPEDREYFSEYLRDNYELYLLNPDPITNGSLDDLSTELRNEIYKLIDLVDIYIKPTNDRAGQELFALTREMLQHPPQNLNSMDVKAWKSAVDIMGYSANYWATNFGNWHYALHPEEQKGNGWFDKLWKKIKVVVVADLAGGAAGASTGFIKTGTWQGAAAGALIGGVSASVSTGVKKALK